MKQDVSVPAYYEPNIEIPSFEILFIMHGFRIYIPTYTGTLLNLNYKKLLISICLIKSVFR